MLPVEASNLAGQAAYHQGALIRPARRFTLVCLAVIGLLTLWPVPAQAPLSAATPFFCLPCGDSGLSDILLNVVLFLPFGMGLRRSGMRLEKVTLVAAGFSLVIELLQLTVIPGRDASAADIVTNALGAFLGGWIAGAGSQALFPGARWAAYLAGGWALAGVVTAAVTAWSLDPSFRASIWYGQWAPFGGEPGWFDGSILAVELGSRPLSHWRLSDSESRRAELMRDTVRLAATVVSIAPPEERLHIVAVADSAGRMVTLSQRQRNLSFGVRTRAADVYLHSPVFLAPGVMPETPGDTVGIEGHYWNGAGLVQGLRGELSPLDGWSLLIGAPVGSRLAIIASFVWLLGWFAPIGFYGGQLRRSAWAVAPAWLLLAFPVLVAVMSGTPLPAAWEVAVGASAALSGRVLCAALEPQSPDPEDRSIP